MDHMDRLKQSGHEQSLIRTGVLVPRELREHIYQGERYPKDKRFLPSEEGGVFKYFYVPELSYLPEISAVYPIVAVDDIVIGLAKLMKAPDDPHTIWLSFLSIDPQFQGKGYASTLAEAAFHYARDNGLGFGSTAYSPVGAKKLKPLFHRLSKEYNIPFIDSDTILRDL